MKNIKRKRRRRPPSQLLGPTHATNYRPSPSHLLSAGPRARSSRPAQTHAQQPSLWPSDARAPSARLRSLQLGCAHQPRAVHPCAPLSFARSRCQRTPLISLFPVHLLHAHADSPLRQNADSTGRERARGSCPGHGLARPLAPRPHNPSRSLDASSRPDRP